jgi:tetratricopeptide (TPR) repeat protein
VIPDDVAATDLDKDVRSELLSLSRDTADLVARHLVAAGQVIEEDADLAMAHAIAARRLASRIAAVREAVGLAAYAAGDWATAIAELRTYHRMTGRQTHLAELADCERALGRPERAIDLYRGADQDALDKAGAIELLIVAAGARGDLGQHDAAVAMLQVRELTADEDAEWAARLRYAYADALLAAGRRDEAREWFARAATADTEDLTDAAERLLELDGVTLEDDSDEDDDEESGDEESGDELSDDADGPATAAGDEFEDDDEPDDDESGDELNDELDDEDSDESSVELDDEDDDEDEVGAPVAEAAEAVATADQAGGSASETATRDEPAGDDPGDRREEHEAATLPRSVAFVDGVESALDSDDDLDRVDSDSDAVDGADAGTEGSPAASNGRVPEPDDEKAAGDEFVAEAPAGDEKRPQA